MYVRFEVPVMVVMKTSVLWDIMPCVRLQNLKHQLEMPEHGLPTLVATY